MHTRPEQIGSRDEGPAGRPPTLPLRVALVVRSREAPGWVTRLGSTLAEDARFRPGLLVVEQAPFSSANKRGFGSRTSRGVGGGRMGARSRAGDLSPFSLADGSAAVPDMVGPFGFDLWDATALADCDVAVAADCELAETLASGALSGRPQDIWFSRELDSSDGRAGLDSPSGIASLRGSSHCTLSVCSMDADAQERCVLSADATLESPRARANRSRAAWAAASLVLAALERRAAQAEASIAEGSSDTRSAPAAESRDAGAPRASASARAAHLVRLAAAASRRVVSRPQWILAYDFDAGSHYDPTPAVRLATPPDDRFWADPHVAVDAGRHYVFVEEYDYSSRKGHIAVLSLEQSGPPGPARVALEADHHLSYPHVFKFEGEWYMIPESSASGRIDAFRAAAFPCEWTHAATLMEGVRAQDTTLVEHGGLWWMFTAIDRLDRDPSLSHLYLFSAAHPLATQWEPHPLNPIAVGAAGVRPAGGILSAGGHLLRPSQDSLGSYGRRLLFRRIDTLTRTDYAESPAGDLTPNAARGFVGLHTLARSGGLTVVDLLRWSRRRAGTQRRTQGGISVADGGGR